MNNKDTLIPEQLSFRVSPRTVQMLGRENISSSVIAVLELVKNAYDADASKVVVTCSQASKEAGKIIIDDNGEGMDLSDLQEKWMVISTDNKLHARTTEKRKRIKVGEKGIGRLAMDRLGQIATITTFRENSNSALELSVDWTKYDQDSGQLHEITHPLARVAILTCPTCE